MLKVPDLNDITYDQILQQAIHRIPTMTDQWTDFNYHDPGITVLQTYAWLVDMLNYYMNATGNVHVEKYLKLLGIKAKSAKAAQTYLNVEAQKEELELLEGTQVYAGNVCFEITGNSLIRPNRFVSFINEVDGQRLDLTMFAGVDEDYAALFAGEFTKEAAAYFGFERPLSGDIALQICVKENSRRNPLQKGFSMSRLQWQYYGTEGWKELLEVQDGTCGFLQNGILKAKIPTSTIPYRFADGERQAHYLRCILKENTYDELPEIGKIYVSPIPAEQKKTLSREIELIYEGQDTLEIPYYIPETAYLMVGITEEEGKGHLIFDETGEHTFPIRLKKGEEPGRKILVFPEMEDRPKVGAVLRIFLVQEELLSDFRQGTTDGCAGQEISFPCEGVYSISVSTWRKAKDGRHTYEIWKYTPDLEAAGYKDKVFTYDFEEQKIRFGDGEHGVVPGQGQSICITGLSISEFENGNVLEHEVNQLPGEQQICLTNPTAATGGSNAESIEMLMKRLETELFKQQRLVSEEDYKTAVADTPGLMIEEVQVIAGKRYGEIHDLNWKDNEVVVVVKPYSDRERPVLGSFYQEQIADWLEEKRLINTKVTIVSPSYVGIEVNGKIRLAHRKQGEQERVLELLRSQILAPEKSVHFGRSLQLGKLFSMLEVSEAVEKVELLSLERLGTGAVKTPRGDIQMYEDALCYISDINIEFC